MSLGRFVPTPFSGSHGATGSQSIPYKGLEDIFENVRLTPDDSFIDIGCGKGRVLAYLTERRVPCRLTGIELNPDVASIARRWSSSYSNVEIIEGDAFGLDLDKYTVLFMYRPMERETFGEFVCKVERDISHRIMLYYYADSESGFLLNDRRGWTLITRQTVYRKGGVYIHMEPQRYSVWKYSPADKNKYLNSFTAPESRQSFPRGGSYSDG